MVFILYINLKKGTNCIMKKTINRKVYNTATAEKVAHMNFGTFGDPKGYEETLYLTKKGMYFLCGKGGDQSKYKEEDIHPITANAAKDWLAKNQKA